MKLPFVLRFEEPVNESEDSLPVHAGTKTVTEVRREAGDSDPGTTTHFAIRRKEGSNGDSICASFSGRVRT
jgi:hypothetical protein